MKSWRLPPWSRRHVLLGGAVAILGTGVAVSLAAGRARAALADVTIIAHRSGSLHAAASSWHGLVAAVCGGANLSLDVVYTRDGVWAYHHEADLEQAFGRALAPESVRHDQVSRWRRRRQPLELHAPRQLGVPSLDAVVAGFGPLILEVEIRSAPEDPAQLAAALSRLAAILTDRAPQAVITSHSAARLMEYRRRLGDGFRYGLVVFDPGSLDTLGAEARQAIDVVDVFERRLTEELVRDLISRGREVWAFDDNYAMSLWRAGRLASWGVSGLVTSRPGRLARLRGLSRAADRRYLERRSGFEMRSLAVAALDLLRR